MIKYFKKLLVLALIITVGINSSITVRSSTGVDAIYNINSDKDLPDDTEPIQ